MKSARQNQPQPHRVNYCETCDERAVATERFWTATLGVSFYCAKHAEAHAAFYKKWNVAFQRRVLR
jgi:hypothetical protein